MGRIRHLLLGIAIAPLLTACGDSSPPDARPSPSATSTASVSVAPSPSPSSSEESGLTEDMRNAFRAAMAAYPGADLDRCTRSTPLNDRACGRAITAASKVANDTARRLRAQSPEYADLLYSGLFLMVTEFQASIRQMRDPIPCYGLSDKPQPPPPLRAEAQSICAEAADIAKVRWRIFVSQVDA